MNRVVRVGVGIVFCGLCEAGTRTTSYIIPPEIGQARWVENRSHFDFEPEDTWRDNGLSGRYRIGDRERAQRVCLERGGDVFSLLGFCRARMLYMHPDRSLRDHLMNTTPSQQWLKEIYLNRVDKFSKTKVANIYKQDAEQAAKILAYCTCTEVPQWEINEHLPQIRNAINSGAWTVADAYEFLCVYPKSSYFFGLFSMLEETDYASCLADSIKTILIKQYDRSWNEIVRSTREEVEEKKQSIDRFRCWGSEKADKEDPTSWGNGDMQKLEVFDIVQAYLFLDTAPSRKPWKLTAAP